MDHRTDLEWLEALHRVDQAMTNLLAHQVQITSSLNEALDTLARSTPKNREETYAKLEAIAKYLAAHRSVMSESRSVQVAVRQVRPVLGLSSNTRAICSVQGKYEGACF
jgi:hypothetical protein